MTRKATAALRKGHVLGRGRAPTVEALMSDSEGTKATWGLRQNDAAFALAFWSMLDCGFECVSGERTLPKDWKHETRQVYEAQFFLPPYSDRPVRLVALPAGDVLCVNVLAAGVSHRNVSLKSLAVCSTGFLPGSDDDPDPGKLCDYHFLLRDVIIWPIRCSILNEEGVMNGSLCGVSDEIKLKIVGHLPMRDVLALSETCHDLNRICNDQALWKTFFHETFKHLCKCASGKGEECEAGTDWKETFKKAHARKKRERTVRDSPPDSYHSVPEGRHGSEIDLDID